MTDQLIQMKLDEGIEAVLAPSYVMAWDLLKSMAAVLVFPHSTASNRHSPTFPYL